MICKWHGMFDCSIIRANKTISNFQIKNALLTPTASRQTVAVSKNLYQTEFLDYQYLNLAGGFYETLHVLSCDYPSFCPPVIGQWYIGLEAWGAAAPHELITEVTSYTDKDGNTQRPLWEPDDPVNGIITNSIPTRYLFTGPAQLTGVFLASSPVFNTALWNDLTPNPYPPAYLYTLARLPNNLPPPYIGQNYFLKSGDEFRIHYRVSFNY